jgi:predicted nucleic acid-binding protein
MQVIDTNIVVRVITKDKPEHATKAAQRIKDGPVQLLTSVVLESVWVLRSVYGLPERQAVQALLAFAGLPNVTMAEPDRMARAFAYSGRGMGFADAVHIAACGPDTPFVTFDSRLQKIAESQGLTCIML